MKKKGNENKYFIIILIVAIIDISYGIIFQVNKYNYKKNTKEIVANIHQITKNKNTNTLYIDYYIDEQPYNGVITTTNKTITIDDRLRIYYQKDNPKKFTDGTISNSGYYIILIGVFSLLIDMKFYISKNKHK